MTLTLFPRIQDVDILLFSDFTFFCSFQAAVVQTLDSAIHRIKIYPMNSAIMVSLILIRWIVIYSVNSAIQRLNNRGQVPNIQILTDQNNNFIVNSNL